MAEEARNFYSNSGCGRVVPAADYDFTLLFVRTGAGVGERLETADEVERNQLNLPQASREGRLPLKQASQVAVDCQGRLRFPS